MKLGWYCGMCDKWFPTKGDGDCKLCGFKLEKALK